MRCTQYGFVDKRPLRMQGQVFSKVGVEQASFFLVGFKRIKFLLGLPEGLWVVGCGFQAQYEVFY